MKSELPEFSTREARQAGARVFVTRLHVALLALGALAHGVSRVLEPGSMQPEILTLLGGAIALQLACFIAIRVGRDPVSVAGLLLFGDTVVAYGFVWITRDPGSASALLPMMIVISGMFMAPRATFALSVIYAAAISGAAQQLDTWGDAYLFPPSALAVLVTGYITGRAMTVVHRLEQTREQLVRDQQRTLDTLEQVAGVRDRLIANVSHELRTPLTTTIGFLDTVLRDDLDLTPEEQRVLVMHAHDGGMRLNSLVEDLLEFGTLRPEAIVTQAEPVQLAALIHDALQRLPRPADRDIDLQLAPTVADTQIHVDGRRMTQVITNLLVNALRHGEGTIMVTADVSSDAVTVSVLDEGHGVAAEHVEEMFLPFARFSSRTDSTGLGLAICRTIVEAHGGTIRYARTSDGWTRFDVRIPAANATLA